MVQTGSKMDRQEVEWYRQEVKWAGGKQHGDCSGLGKGQMESCNLMSMVF